MVAGHQNEEVLGVSMIGPSAGEVIHEAAMGLRFRAKIRDFIELLHVDPAMAEALKIAVSRFEGPGKAFLLYGIRRPAGEDNGIDDNSGD